jgi:hypothetical protein
MRFNLLIFSFVAKQFLHRQFEINGLCKDEYHGYDHRYIIKNETTLNLTYSSFILNENLQMTSEEMHRFNDYFYKFKLVKKLQNHDISEINKLTELEKYEGYNNKSKYTLDLTAGGLFKDWDINIL